MFFRRCNFSDVAKSLKSRPVVQNRHKKALHRLALTRRLLDHSVGPEPHDGYKYVAAVSRLRPNERERYRDQVDDDTGSVLVNSSKNSATGTGRSGIFLISPSLVRQTSSWDTKSNSISSSLPPSAGMADVERPRAVR